MTVTSSSSIYKTPNLSAELIETESGIAYGSEIEVWSEKGPARSGDSLGILRTLCLVKRRGSLHAAPSPVLDGAPDVLRPRADGMRGTATEYHVRSSATRAMLSPQDCRSSPLSTDALSMSADPHSRCVQVCAPTSVPSAFLRPARTMWSDRMCPVGRRSAYRTGT